MFNLLAKEIEKHNSEFKFATVSPTSIIFQERNQVLCFYKWTRPPHIPKCDYKKVILEYENGLLVYKPTQVNYDYESVRTESVQLHNYVSIGAIILIILLNMTNLRNAAPFLKTALLSRIKRDVHE